MNFKGWDVMSKFTASKVVLEPIEDVFKGFIKVNKREFPKFPDKNPLGSKCTKMIKQSANQTLKMVMKVTDYELDSLYQVSGELGKDLYISTYKFIAEAEDRTRIELVEEQKLNNIGSKIGMLLGTFSAGSKTKKKLERVAEGIEEEIEALRRKQERSKKKA